MTEKDKDFLEGLAISAACHVLPVRKKLPIAYSYNGVILPALPEWDREMYPYAFIGHNFIMTPILYVASEITHGYDDYDYWVAYGVRIATYDGTANAWTESDGAESYQNVSRIDWANFDVLNEDGSVYLSASEPIPVYE